MAEVNALAGLKRIAETMEVSRGTVRTWIRLLGFPARLVGATYLVLTEDIGEWIRRLPVATSGKKTIK